MNKNFLELFLGGIFVGSSTCLLVCAPILLPFVLGTAGNWKKGLQATLIFSAGRITICILFGLLLGLGKQIYLDSFLESQFNFELQIFFGLFIFLIGFLLILGKHRLNICPGLGKLLTRHNLKTVFILGLLMGIIPCGPLMAVFAYIFIKATNLISSVLLTLAFGLGTTISPMLVLGAFSGFIPQKIPKTKFLKVLKIFAGLILMFWGLQIILSRMGMVIRL